MTETQKKNALAAGTDQGAEVTTLHTDVKLLSGFGQHHTNKYGDAFDGITYQKIIGMAS